MTGLQHFLEQLNNNWPTISICIVLILGIYAKVKKFYQDWQKKTEEEKQVEFDRAVEEARKALANFILGYVSEAEIHWKEQGMGEIKRSEVLARVYQQYPILASVADQDKLIGYIDLLIDEALKTVREKIRVE